MKYLHVTCGKSLSVKVDSRALCENKQSSVCECQAGFDTLARDPVSCMYTHMWNIAPCFGVKAVAYSRTVIGRKSRVGRLPSPRYSLSLSLWLYFLRLFPGLR